MGWDLEIVQSYLIWKVSSGWARCLRPSGDVSWDFSRSSSDNIGPYIVGVVLRLVERGFRALAVNSRAPCGELVICRGRSNRTISSSTPIVMSFIWICGGVLELF